MKKIMAISSSGGHWIQLMRLKQPIFDRHNTLYVGTNEGMQGLLNNEKFYTVEDCNLSQKLRVSKCFWQVLIILIKERPDIVISTGAAPGFLAIFIAKMMFKKTIWLDSLANTKKLSVSGKHVGRFADLWLTQWEEVANSYPDNGPKFKGRVI